MITSDITAELTYVELTWLEKRIEHWIKFGNIAAEKVLDRRRRIVSFATRPQTGIAGRLPS